MAEESQSTSQDSKQDSEHKIKKLTENVEKLTVCICLSYIQKSPEGKQKKKKISLILPNLQMDDGSDPWSLYKIAQEGWST